MARSAAVRSRPSSSANRSRVGAASAATCRARLDQAPVSAAGTPGDLGLAVRVDRVEPDPEAPGQLGPQRGLVEGAGGLLVVVDLVPVDAAPRPVGAAKLVDHQGVGVQLRVAAPGAAVVEDRGGETGRANRGHPVDPFTGHRRMLVQKRQRGPDRGPMRLRNLVSNLWAADGPQRGHRFRRRERQVEPSNPVRPPGPAQPMPGLRVQPAGQQRLQLLLGDHRVRGQAQLGQAPPEPATRRLTAGQEVLRRVGGHLALVVPPRASSDFRRAQHAAQPSIPRMHMSALSGAMIERPGQYPSWLYDNAVSDG